MNSNWRLVGLGCALMFGSADLLVAQPATKRVKYQVGCAMCRVEFTRIATLGKRSDPAGISTGSGVDRDSQGRFFVFSDDYRLLVYDAKGNFLKALGRRGDGPGEFNGPRIGTPKVVVGRGDTIFVFQASRTSLYSPQLQFVRTWDNSPPATTMSSIFSIADGSWLFGALVYQPANVGRTVHVMDSDGTIRRSLGPEFSVVPARASRPARRFVMAPNQRSLWFAGASEYSLEQWSLNGGLLSRLEIYDVPWLPKPTQATIQGRYGPVATLVGEGSASLIGIDTLGQLWIFGRPPPPSRQAGDASSTIRPGILQVVDPITGEIRSSQEMPQPMPLLPKGDLAFSASFDGAGVVSIAVWSYRFVTR